MNSQLNELDYALWQDSVDRDMSLLAAFILAAFITPTPDIITQSLLALPMIVLYEASLVLCKFLLK